MANFLGGYTPPQQYQQQYQPYQQANNSVIVVPVQGEIGANIAIPTGGTVGAISVAITIDGATIPSSTMTVTPAAVEQFFNVSRAINAGVFAGCCESISVRNTSDQPILVQNANIIISRPDLAVTR